MNNGPRGKGRGKPVPPRGPSGRFQPKGKTRKRFVPPVQTAKMQKRINCLVEALSELSLEDGDEPEEAEPDQGEQGN